MDYINATGAHPSHFDQRTFTHNTMDVQAGTPFTGTGGVIYKPEEIEMQSKVGICTAISVVQNAEKANGKKYSPDFHWLLQKMMFDQNWYEGSEILNSLKVAKNYGFLPISEWTYTTEADRKNYDSYIAKLKAIPYTEVLRLRDLCVDKIAGYANINLDPQSIAQGIVDSKCGIIVMLQSGSTWWTDKNGNNSWKSTDIDPIRVPTESLSGHAIGASYFDYTSAQMVTCPNTWSMEWDEQGNCHINLGVYKLYEAWIPYYELTPALIQQQQQLQTIQNGVAQANVTLQNIIKLVIAWLKGV
jgi:hypothetical protein